MLQIEDLIYIQKNQLKYRIGKSSYKGVPEGVYEVEQCDYEEGRTSGPILELSLAGAPLETTILVDWKSLSVSNKWRKL